MDKTCSKCKSPKSLDCFYKDKNRKDGISPYCKNCQKSYGQNPDRKREWYKQHRELTLARASQRQKEKKVERRLYLKEYYQRNRHLYAWRSLVRRTCSNKGNQRTLDLLGYTADELRTHLERLWTPGMSWDNYGEWHIDHIRAIVEFGESEHPSVVNALSNLRPLWATTREIDGVVYEGNLNRNHYKRKRLQG